MRHSPVPTAVAALLTAILFAACDRDSRAVPYQTPRAGQRADAVPQTDLSPGVRAVRVEIQNPYAGDRRALQEGKRLYDWFNCSGCHFGGGGGIGPPLTGDDWIYGGRPAQLFDSIASGRANGMPAYADKLTADQIWHLVTYVETLGETMGERRDRVGTDDLPRRDDR